MRLKRIMTALLVCLLLSACSFSGAETLQECHKVTNEAKLTTQKNKSQVKVWHVETAHPAVTEEINTIADAWAKEYARR